VIRSIDQPVYLLGYSYGAQAALLAAAEAPDRVRKLVLYEPAWPHVVEPTALARLETFARAGDWNSFGTTFFHERLHVPLKDLNELRSTELWAPVIADAEASLRDLRALSRYDFLRGRFSQLRIPCCWGSAAKVRGTFMRPTLSPPFWPMLPFKSSRVRRTRG
jgi:pimeloyl-ACP methyl ester carboxylesterase